MPLVLINSLTRQKDIFVPAAWFGKPTGEDGDTARIQRMVEARLAARSARDYATADAQRSIVDSFRYLEDLTERYQYLIELGRRLPPFPETKRIEANRLHGRQACIRFISDGRDGELAGNGA